MMQAAVTIGRRHRRWRCSLPWGRILPARWGLLLLLVWRGRAYASPILLLLLLLLLLLPVLLLVLNWRAWRRGRGCCCWRCSWWRCRQRLLLLCGACDRGGCGLELAALDLDLAVVVLLRSKRVCV